MTHDSFLGSDLEHRLLELLVYIRTQLQFHLSLGLRVVCRALRGCFRLLSRLLFILFTPFWSWSDCFPVLSRLGRHQIRVVFGLYSWSQVSLGLDLSSIL